MRGDLTDVSAETTDSGGQFTPKLVHKNIGRCGYNFELKSVDYIIYMTVMNV